jgi:hypothetical protein
LTAGRGRLSAARSAAARPVLDREMAELITNAGTMFVATTGRRGESNQTVRTGPPGFVRVLDGRRIAWREPAGLIGTGTVGTGPVELLFVDFFGAGLGLRVAGAARASGPSAGRCVEVAVVDTHLERVEPPQTPRFGPI